MRERKLQRLYILGEQLHWICEAGKGECSKWGSSSLTQHHSIAPQAPIAPLGPKRQFTAHLTPRVNLRGFRRRPEQLVTRRDPVKENRLKMDDGYMKNILIITQVAVPGEARTPKIFSVILRPQLISNSSILWRKGCFNNHNPRQKVQADLAACMTDSAAKNTQALVTL